MNLSKTAYQKQLRLLEKEKHILLRNSKDKSSDEFKNEIVAIEKKMSVLDLRMFIQTIEKLLVIHPFIIFGFQNFEDDFHYDLIVKNEKREVISAITFFPSHFTKKILLKALTNNWIYSESKDPESIEFIQNLQKIFGKSNSKDIMSINKLSLILYKDKINTFIDNINKESDSFTF